MDAQLSCGKSDPLFQRIGVQLNSVPLTNGLARRNAALSIFFGSPNEFDGRTKSEDIVMLCLAPNGASVNPGLVLAKSSHLG